MIHGTSKDNDCPIGNAEMNKPIIGNGAIKKFDVITFGKISIDFYSQILVSPFNDI